MGFFKKDKKESNSSSFTNTDNSILKEVSENENVNSYGVDSANDSKTVCTSSTNIGTIKILGSGCKNCITLFENVKVALEEMKLEANMIKVTDLAEITGYGVMSTPALVVNEKVVSYGKVLKPSEVIKILTKILGV